jgi:hypothetical protein
MMSAAHLHLILNHTPVVGSVFVFLLLAWAVFRRSDQLKRTALGAAVLVALATIPTYLTGEPAWEDIMDLPGENDSFIEAHQLGAKFAFGASALTGVAALITLVKSRGGRPVPAKLPALVLILLLGTCALMTWVANLGGMIRHTEIRAPGATQ